jgi:hypothetical protein
MHSIYRLFFGLIILAVILTFLSLFISTGTHLIAQNPKAMDFLAFYTGAKIYSQMPSALYNLHLELLMQQHIIPITKTQAIFIPFINPPFVVLPFMLFIKFSVTQAYAIWTIINSILVLVICYLSYRMSKNLKPYLKILMIIGILTYIPILTTLLIGQLSILLALIFLLAWIFLKNGWEFRSGLLLSLLLIKPQYFILPFIALLFQRKIKLFCGMLTGMIIIVALSFILVGEKGIVDFISTLNLLYQADPQFGVGLMEQHSLQTALLILFHTQNPVKINVAWIISLAVICIPTLFVWTKQFSYNSKEFAYQFALLILATLLISPHTHFHDLSILVAAGSILFSVISKLKLKKKNILGFFLLAGYAIALGGFLLDMQTYLETRYLWILVSVGFMLLLWIYLLKQLIQTNNKN